MIISSEQVRAARALLRWEQKDLAAASKVSLPAIKRLETVRGPLAAQDRTIEAIRSAFAAAGVEFTNGGEPGVKLRSVSRLVDAGEALLDDLIGKVSRSIDDEDARAAVQSPHTVPQARHEMKEIVDRGLDGKRK